MAVPKRLPPTLEAELFALNAEVAALPQLAFGDLIPLLIAATNELDAGVVELASRIDVTAPMSQAEVNLGNRLFGPAVEAYIALREPLRSALMKGADNSYSLADRHLHINLERVAQRLGDLEGFAPVVRVLISENGRRTLLERYDRLANRYGADVRADIRRQLAIGLIRGESFEQMTRRIVGRMGTPTDLGNKLGARYWYNARRIVRTEVINAYNTAAADGVRDLRDIEPDILMRWSSALDGRTCLDCRRLDGLAIPPTATFPGGVKNPPLHPNCRCVVTAWRPDWGRLRAVS